MRLVNEYTNDHLSKKSFLNTTEDLTIMFYQSRFSEITNFNDQYITSSHEYTKVKLLKSKALFELNRSGEALEIVNKILNSGKAENNPDYIYVRASLNYFIGKYDEALILFKEALEINHSEEGRFKALLGLGNLAYSQGRFEDAFEYLIELKKLQNSLPADLNISLIHFEANILMANKNNLARVNELLEFSYKQALEQGWSFFCQRTLYLMAKLNKMLGNKGEALGILKVLDMQLQFSDARYLAKLVNLEFEKISFKASQNVQLDSQKKTVHIGNKDKVEIDLERWPILFKFVSLLHEAKCYVSKEQIAHSLWENQKYKPRTHDPRIYDLVKRVKKQFEQVEGNPLMIEVQSGGYRLNFS